MKNIAFVFRATFAAASIVLLTGGLSLVQAQGPGTLGPTPAAPTDPTGVPIDGGASLLLAGGVAYGIRKLRAARQQRASQPR